MSLSAWSLWWRPALEPLPFLPPFLILTPLPSSWWKLYDIHWVCSFVARILKSKPSWECTVLKWSYLLYQAYLIDSSVGKESTCNAGDPGSIPRLGSSPGEGTGYPLQYSWASLVAQTVKNPPVMRETWVWSLGWEDPLEVGHGNPLHYPCLENPHGQRSLRGYSPLGHKESDMTEWLSLAAIKEWRKGGKETRFGEILFPRLSP